MKTTSIIILSFIIALIAVALFSYFMSAPLFFVFGVWVAILSHLIVYNVSIGFRPTLTGL
jgi:hypothetical protein